jgi:hypothetical protein
MDDDLDEVVKQDPVTVEPLKLENCAFGGDGRLTVSQSKHVCLFFIPESHLATILVMHYPYVLFEH